jgi:hypothetical protein
MPIRKVEDMANEKRLRFSRDDEPKAFGKGERFRCV